MFMPVWGKYTNTGCIPNAATLNPVSCLEMGFLFFRVCVGVRHFNFLFGSALREPDPRRCEQLSRVSTNGNATLCSAVCHSIFARYFTDTGAYFYLLARMSGGTVLSYSSSRKRSRTLGRAEANYHALVSQSTPATPAQIVAEFDSYATTVNVPLVKALD